MRAFLLLFLLSLVVRLGTLSLIPRDLIPPNPQWETGAAAISLATRGVMADPYLIPTGPTAHMPPLNVAAMSLVYRVFGTGFAGGLIRWVLVMVAASVLWGLMPWLGQALGVGRRAGILGGVAGALFVTFPSELESYSGLALALMAGAFYLRWKGMSEAETGPWGSFLLGLALGIAFHLQPVLLPVALGYLAFEAWLRRREFRREGHLEDRRDGRRARTWRPLALVTLGMGLACVPWGVRNYATFHQIIFVRGNLGLELYVGNHDGAHADIDVSAARGSFRHPRTDLAEAERLLALGEAPYMREKQTEALDWIRTNPGEFAKLTATRFLYFWAGPLHDPSRAAPYLILTLLALVGAGRVLPSLSATRRAALLIPLGAYPLIYYVVAYMPRYGEPVRWVLFLLAGAAVLGPVRLTPAPPAASGAD